ncbi:hypothetical protein SAY87_006508 [Trapa incisa]|uniref:Uncharacterized protein n=1 Tax=Trapa incisa TaxID=236973 RepID=A0AAN7JYB5_9MYRT|nr:hypothetical protein SAY87_006508 [Trapa incisa]
MDDSAAILCQISTFKEMLDQVNEEIESNIQVTRQLESEILRCSELETALSVREDELTKFLYTLHFELNSLMAVTVESRNSVKHLEEELLRLKSKKEEIIQEMARKREGFISLCLEFQNGISQWETDELGTLVSEREFLENEIDSTSEGRYALGYSTPACLEEYLSDLYDSNTALQVEIHRGMGENEQVLNDIEELKSKLLHK